MRIFDPHIHMTSRTTVDYEQLYAAGVRHFHFYTLNRAELSYAICHLLGVRAETPAWRTTSCTLTPSNPERSTTVQAA